MPGRVVSQIIGCIQVEALSNTNPAPGNGVGLKIWQCYDNLAAQQWFYTDDNRIKLNAPGPSNHVHD